MDKSKVFWEDLGVTAEISAFTPQDKIEEFHVMLHVEPRAELFDGQLKRIYEGEEFFGACVDPFVYEPQVG